MSTVTTAERRPAAGVRYLYPGDAGFEQSVTAWNLLGSHTPAVVALAEQPDHVVQAVRKARAEGLGVGVMATGHGTGFAVRGGMLINTAAMRDLIVDPVSRTARVEAGVTWAELNGRASQHGLIGLQGSNSHLGVVGYSLGGGFGWLGRHFGFASQSIVAAELVTASGELITVDAAHHPELFWGLRGSAGNLGVVTALELRLFEVDVVYGGSLFYPLTDAVRVLTGYAAWAEQQDDAMASSAALVNFPPLPFVPEQLRGGSFVCVRLCYSGGDLGRGVAAVRDLRHALGEPLVDQVSRIPARDLDLISSEPVDPLPAMSHSGLAAELTPGMIAAVAAAMTPQSGLLFVELRRLGGALRVPSDQLSPINRTGARYSVNAIALAVPPGGVRSAERALETLAHRLAPFLDRAGYVNFLEGGTGASRMHTAFSEPEWRRLQELKGRWDPSNLFRFNRNIPPRGGDHPRA
jgi:FAD/FMN-containing dehydrogenase